MGFKKNIKDKFLDDKAIIIERYKASRFILVFVSFLFFVIFYFVWAWFYSNILIEWLGFIYILLLISLIFYFYFLFKKLLINNEKKYFNIIIFIILLIIFWFLSLPIIIDWWFNWLIKLITLYS